MCGLLYQWLSLINQRYGQIDISQQETLPSCRGWLLTHESCRNGGEEELLAPDRDSVLGVLHLPDQVLQLPQEDYNQSALWNETILSLTIPCATQILD